MYDPEGYESNKAGPARDAELYIPKMVGLMTWRNNERVLDYGCGAGSTGAYHILPTVESTDSQMFSVDISQDMIAYAQKTHPSPRVTYSVGNILSDDFPFKEIQFDKIFSVYVLHFMKDFRETLKRFHELLKPGGYLGFTVITVSPMFYFLRKFGQDPKWSEYLKGYEEFVPEWVEQDTNPGDLYSSCLTDIGFRILDFSAAKKEYVYDKFETILEMIISLNPFVKKIPSALQSEFKQEHREFLYEFWNLDRNSEGRTHTTYEMLYAVAQK